MEFCQLAVPAPLCLQKTDLHAWGWEKEEMGESFPLDGFQRLEQIKGHSCFTFNWKQPNCKINPGSTCVHDDSIVAGFSESALTFCHMPSPDVLHTVLLARRTCSSAPFYQPALSQDGISAAFFQNQGVQDESKNSTQVLICACMRVHCKLPGLCWRN